MEGCGKDSELRIIEPLRNSEIPRTIPVTNHSLRIIASP